MRLALLPIENKGDLWDRVETNPVGQWRDVSYNPKRSSGIDGFRNYRIVLAVL
jgi:hypothetical protein